MNSIQHHLIALFFLATTTTFAYDPPKFEVDYLDTDLLLLDESEVDTLVNLLVKLAVNFPESSQVDSDLQEKALAVALKLAPLHKHARTAHKELSANQTPSKLAPVNSSLTDVADHLWKLTEPISDPNLAGAEAAKLANYIREIALISHPKPATDRVTTFRAAATANPLQWSRFVKLQLTNASTIRGKQLVNPSLVAQPTSPTATPVRRTPSQEVTFFGTKSSGGDSRPVDVFGGTTTPPSTMPSITSTTSATVATPSRPVPPKVVINYDKLKQTEVSLNYACIVMSGVTPVPAVGSVSASIKDANQQKFVVKSDLTGVKSIFYGSAGSALAFVKTDYPNWPPQKTASILLQTDKQFKKFAKTNLNLPAAILLQSAFSGKSINQQIAFTEFRAHSQVSADRLGRLIRVASDDVKQEYLVIVDNKYDVLLEIMLETQKLDQLFTPAIISFSDWGELKQIAFEPSEKREQAQKEFREIEAAAARMSLVEMSQNKLVQEKLEKITALYPQHLSAKVMLGFGKKIGSQNVEDLAEMTQLNFKKADKIAAASFETVKKILKYSVSSTRYEGDIKDDAEEAKRTLLKIHSGFKDDSREYLFQYKDVLEAMEMYLSIKNRETPTGKTRLKSLREEVAKLNNLRSKVGLKRFPGLD